MSRTLVVTNDFPPRIGGIQEFVHALAVRQPPGSLVVYASTYQGAARFDAEQPFPVVRHPTGLLVPTPDAQRRIRAVAKAERCDTVWYGAAAPLGLLSAGLRRVGVERFVATTHGHEAGWAALPVARQLLRRVGRQVDVVTYLGDYFRRRIAGALGPHPELVRLPPGVDTDRFHPDVDGAGIRAELGLTDRPTVACVSRLVPRKGQDVLIRALPAIQRRVPGTALIIVGDGPDFPRLHRLAASLGIADDVLFTGKVPAADLPRYYAAGDVFAMPARTRHAGLDVEGLGIVYLEASAVGRPVVAGDSGGAPDAVLPGETGHVVNGRDVTDVARRIADLLADPTQAAAMGRAGRAWVEREWRWDLLAHRLHTLLTPQPVP